MGGGGGVVWQTDDVGQGGAKKSVFARTSLMDDSNPKATKITAHLVLNNLYSKFLIEAIFHTFFILVAYYFIANRLR